LSIAAADPHGLEPWARLLDTVLGCAVALVAGVLLWPRRGLPDQARTCAAATAALRTQIELELGQDAVAPARSSSTDEMYRITHAWRAELERDLAELDPARAAVAWLPVALQLERTVDAVCAAGTRARRARGGYPPDRLARLRDLLRDRPPPTASDAVALLTTVVAQLDEARASNRDLGAAEPPALT
jgi:uncharacterized membrane protein YccC